MIFILKVNPSPIKVQHSVASNQESRLTNRSLVATKWIALRYPTLKNSLKNKSSASCSSKHYKMHRTRSARTSFWNRFRNSIRMFGRATRQLRISCHKKFPGRQNNQLKINQRRIIAIKRRTLAKPKKNLNEREAAPNPLKDTLFAKWLLTKWSKTR